MGWLTSTMMLVLMATSVGVIVLLPSVFQSPVFYIVPVLFFLAFLYTLDIE